MATKKAKPAVKTAKRSAAASGSLPPLPFKNLGVAAKRPWTITAGPRGSQSHLVTSSVQMLKTGARVQRTSFTVPGAVQDRLRDAIIGPWTSTMVVLADWALDQLEASGQQLTIVTNVANAAAVTRRHHAHAAGMRRARDAKEAAAKKKKRVKAAVAVPSITGPVIGPASELEATDARA